MLPAHSKQPAIPVWGRWLIGSILAAILLIVLIASPHAWDNLAQIFAGLAPIVLLAGGALAYFLPAICGQYSPRAAAIFLANLFFGWTGIGWVIVFIWAVAESGTAAAERRKNQTPG